MKNNRSKRTRYGVWTLMALAMLLLIVSFTASTAALPNYNKTYTLDADFDMGTLINVNHDAPDNDQLQLNPAGEPFDFIWVAASARGTVVKIDTLTGAVLGEYWSSPQGMGKNPSRTTVDANGNVWTGNRGEISSIGGVAHGSAVKIGLEENGQCVDRNGNSTIDTSTGLGDIRPWPNITDGAGSTDGAAHVAQVQDAADECILIFQRLPDAEYVRHVSVDTGNDVWVGGYPGSQRSFHKLDELTGAILATFDARSYGCGGYGGLIDSNNVLWSASINQSKLLRYDIGSNTGSCLGVSSSYGLGIDGSGYVWNSMWTNNSIVKVSPTGVIQAGFPTTTGGASNDRGVAVTADGHVWVANSGGNSVSRLDNNGNVLKVITVGSTPTGVAVDAAGKVWATNLSSDNVMRINPSGGGDSLGAVDLMVPLGAGAGPYNYSDMTGSIVPAPPTNGSWTVVHDSGVAGTEWGYVTWNEEPEGATPGDSSLEVKASSSTDGSSWSTPQAVIQGVDLTVPDGQYLRVQVFFARATTGESPILSDLTIIANRDPECDEAGPSLDMLWPPNHKFQDIDIVGVTDPDGDPVTITIDSIWQDELVDELGDGTFAPDGDGVGTSTAEVRAERSGLGDGRFYHISFTADDGKGGTCSSVVNVTVPHDRRGAPPLDGGALYDSTVAP